MKSPGNDIVLDTWPKPFKDAFCERFHCPSEGYESALFWRCVPRRALPLAFLLLRRTPQRFTEDFDLIREVASMTSPELFKNEINYFHGRNLRSKSWIRRAFKVRVSGARLMRIKRKVFSEARPARREY